MYTKTKPILKIKNKILKRYMLKDLIDGEYYMFASTKMRLLDVTYNEGLGNYICRCIDLNNNYWNIYYDDFIKKAVML